MTETYTETALEEENTQHGKYLTFALGTETYGMQIQFVTEIVGMQKISNLPESPAYVKGIINLRGKIIPVIDMGVKFKKEQASYTDRTCIIVMEIHDICVGLIVDRVDEVVAVPDQSIVPPPDFKTGFQNKYISGISKIDKNICLLLDCERLFNEEEIAG